MDDKIENFNPEVLDGTRTTRGEDVEIRLFQRTNGTQFLQVVVRSRMGKDGHVLRRLRLELDALSRGVHPGKTQLQARLRIMEVNRRIESLERHAKAYVVKKIGQMDRSISTGTTEKSERRTVGTLAGALAEELCEQCGDDYSPEEMARMAMEAHRELLLDIQTASSSALAH